MFATVFEKQGQFGIEIGEPNKPTVEWTPLEALPQDGTLNEYLLNHGLAPVGQWNLRNKVSRVQLRWAPSPAVLLGVVAPKNDPEIIVHID